MKKKFPLAAAKITVEAVPGSPGSYKAIAYLRPWLQFEELTASIRMVTNLPAATK
jgi:type VI secretion system protein ImpC